MSGSFIDTEIDNIVSKFEDEPVIKILKILDWKKISKIANKAKRINTGRHRIPYSPVLMMKIFLLQSMHGLSDVQMEKQLNFNLLFMKFCDLSTNDRKPDHSTISIWRNRFISLNIHDKLFAEINKQFEKLGLILHNGSVVDATIISSHSRPRRKQFVVNETEETKIESNNQRKTMKKKEQNNLDKASDNNENQDQSIKIEESKDPDARFLLKGKKIHYGYKMTTAVDPINGFIQAVLTTAANIPDCKLLESILSKVKLKRDSFVFADKGYASESNRNLIKDFYNYKDGIMHKAAKNRPLSELQKLSNKKISTVRFIVEQPYGLIKKRNGDRAKYIGLKKVSFSNVFNCIIHNLVRSFKFVSFA